MEIKNNPPIQEYISIDHLVAKNISPYVGQKHLDFGCSDGFTTSLLAENTPNSQIIGFDINKEGIDYAKKFYSRRNLKFTDSFEDIKNKKFDSINLNYVYHEISNSHLDNVCKLLKPNGKIIFIDSLWELGDNKDYDDCSPYLKKSNFKILERSFIPDGRNTTIKLIAQKIPKI